MKKAIEYLYRPVPAHSFAAFRILFGGILFWELCRYFLLGRVERYYITPELTLPFKYFEWLPHFSAPVIYGIFWTMLLCSALVILGWFYRAAIIVLSVCYAYSLFIDTTNYQNHLYLFCLLLLLLSFTNPHAIWSLDSRFRKDRIGTVPNWEPLLFKFQVGLVYLFGGLEKLHPEWLSGRSPEAILPFGHSAALDAITGILGKAGTLYGFTYGGLFLDFALVPMLLFRRTRALGILCVLFFNLICSQVFTIGVFPWFMIAATVLFVDPALLARLGGGIPANPVTGTPEPRRLAVLPMLACYCAFQLVFPLRHFLSDGSYMWNGKGRYFSWTMMQCARDGQIRFYVKDQENGRQYPINIDQYLTERQIRKMAFNPQSVLYFSVYLQKIAKGLQLTNYSIHAQSTLDLNKKGPVPFIKEEVDLSKVTLRTDVDEILYRPADGYLASNRW
jgi:vitamin K-dependent gamma-carboxylase